MQSPCAPAGAAAAMVARHSSPAVGVSDRGRCGLKGRLRDPCLAVALRTGCERVVQPVGKGEVPDLIGRELEFTAAVGQLMRWQRHDPGVVDEQVQRPFPGGDEGAHGVEVREVKPADADGLVAGRVTDIDGGSLAGSRVADREHHIGAPGGERAGVSMPMPDDAPVTIARRRERSMPSATSQIVDAAPKPV